MGKGKIKGLDLISDDEIRKSSEEYMEKVVCTESEKLILKLLKSGIKGLTKEEIETLVNIDINELHSDKMKEIFISIKKFFEKGYSHKEDSPKEKEDDLNER